MRARELALHEIVGKRTNRRCVRSQLKVPWLQPVDLYLRERNQLNGRYARTDVMAIPEALCDRPRIATGSMEHRDDRQVALKRQLWLIFDHYPQPLEPFSCRRRQEAVGWRSSR